MVGDQEQRALVLAEQLLLEQRAVRLEDAGEGDDGPALGWNVGVAGSERGDGVVDVTGSPRVGGCSGPLDEALSGVVNVLDGPGDQDHVGVLLSGVSHELS
jgi:hypothetical protein